VLAKAVPALRAGRVTLYGATVWVVADEGVIRRLVCLEDPANYPWPSSDTPRLGTWCTASCSSPCARGPPARPRCEARTRRLRSRRAMQPDNDMLGDLPA